MKLSNVSRGIYYRSGWKKGNPPKPGTKVAGAYRHGPSEASKQWSTEWIFTGMSDDGEKFVVRRMVSNQWVYEHIDIDDHHLADLQVAYEVPQQ